MPLASARRCLRSCHSRKWGTVSKRHFITIRTANSNQLIDLELPGDQPVGDLMENILRATGLPTAILERKLTYYLLAENGKVIPPISTLTQAGVENFDQIYLEATSDNAPAFVVTEDSVIGVADPFPSWLQLPVQHSALLSESGIMFILEKPVTLIGRRSQTQQPDIDLTRLDTEMVASRQHARIHRIDIGFEIESLPAKNGMFLNGAELIAGARRLLTNGDELQFGFSGVKLIFREAAK